MNRDLLCNPIRIQELKENFQKYIEENDWEGINKSVVWDAEEVIM